MAGCDNRWFGSQASFPSFVFYWLDPHKMGFSHSLNINDCLDNSFPMQVSFVLDFQSCHHDLSGFHNEQLLHFYLELVSVQKVSSTLMTLTIL